MPSSVSPFLLFIFISYVLSDRELVSKVLIKSSVIPSLSYLSDGILGLGHASPTIADANIAQAHNEFRHTATSDFIDLFILRK